MKKIIFLCTCLLFYITSGRTQITDTSVVLTDSTENLIKDVYTLNSFKKLDLHFERFQTIGQLYANNKRVFDSIKITENDLQIAWREFNRTTDKKIWFRSKANKVVEKAILMKYATPLLRKYKLLDTKIPKDSVRFSVEKIKTYHIAYKTYRDLDEIIEGLEFEKKKSDTTYVYGLHENLEIVSDQLQGLLKKDYCMYNNKLAGNEIIKYISLYHDNDFLRPPCSLNLDRNYTGGFRIEVGTDFLKMNFLSALFSNANELLTYQALFMGGEGYTPYIRELDSLYRISLYAVDRPFASYAYFGRAKYRMPYQGFWRLMTEFKIGTIGGKAAENIQSVIHRDIVIASVHPIGWDEQIANGGRIALNFDANFELLLFSTKGTVFMNPYRNKKVATFLKEMDKKDVPASLNFSAILEGKYGHDIAMAGIGLGFSTMSLIERSGSNEMITFKNTRKKWSVEFNASIRFRHIYHNTMLEGFGTYKTFGIDPYDIDPVSVHTIDSADILRNICLFDWGFHFRAGKTIFFYKAFYQSPEYKVGGAPDDFLDKYYINGKYGWGQVGFSFLI